MRQKISPSDPMYQEAQSNMDLELAQRSPAAAIVFLTAAILFLFALDLEGILDVYVKIFCLALVGINFHRLRIGQRVAKSNYLGPAQRKFLYLNIYVNSTLFAILFAMISFQIGFKDWRILAVMIGFFAIAVGSPFTLSYSRSLLFYFIASWNLPQLAILIYQCKTNQIEMNSLILFSGYFLANMAYGIKQGISYREQLFDKFINDIKLKNTTLELLKSRQKIIEQTAMTQQANRLSALGEMAAGMAHEINTPLAVIQMRADKLHDLAKTEKLDHARIVEEIKKITGMVLRISKIIQGLRAFSRDSADDPMQPTEISQILEESLNLCQEKFRNKSIALKVSSDQIFYLDCVPFQIVQVMVNLLSNSFDAVKDLPDPWVEIKAYRFEDYARLDVIDSGPGVSPEIIDKIMQPFFTTKEVGQGTGLGLSVSKGIVERHRGNLQYLQVNGFTCFRVNIPLKKA